MINVLSDLATDLERIFEKHPSCEDSDVRDHICAALQAVIIEGNLSYKVPTFFGVFNPWLNLKLRKAVVRCVTSESVRRLVETTPMDIRVHSLKDAFELDSICSQSGTPLTEILGEWV